MPTEFEKEREEWRQIGFKLGFIDGFIRGAQEFPLRQLERRFGQVSKQAEKQVRSLLMSDVYQLSLDLLDFEKPSDLTKWLRRHKPKRRL